MSQQAPAEDVERELRPGDVGDDEVEEALPGLQPGGLRDDRGRGEVGHLRQHVGADGLLGLLQVAHRLADQAEPLDRVLAPDRQRGHHRGHLIAERAVLIGGADADRHHRLQDQLVRRVAERAQMPAERAGDDGQHDVVDRASVRVLDPPQVGEIAADPGEATVGADLDVERRVGGRESPARDRSGGADRVADRGQGLDRSADQRRAPRAAPRPAGSTARSGRRRAAASSPGSGRGSHSAGGSAGAGSGSASKRTVVMSTPETPSTRQ